MGISLTGKIHIGELPLKYINAGYRLGVNMTDFMDVGLLFMKQGQLAGFILANLDDHTNRDGSAWKPWSEYTEILRARGIVRTNPTIYGTHRGMMYATGELYHKIAESKAFYIDSIRDDEVTYHYDMDMRQAENEVGNPNRNLPKRELFYLSDEAIDRFLSMMLANIDDFNNDPSMEEKQFQALGW